jgi:hypothetical protein
LCPTQRIGYGFTGLHYTKKLERAKHSSLFLLHISDELKEFYYVANRGQCYKTFLSVIYGFSYQARVFVRLDWKSLPMTNTLAYHENAQFTALKSFITLGPGRLNKAYCHL